MEFTSIPPSSATRPPTQNLRLTEFQDFLWYEIPTLSPTFHAQRSKWLTTPGAQMIKMNVAISTWLVIGAGLQSLLVLALPVRYAVCPAILFLCVRLMDKLLVALGLRSGLLTDGVITSRTAAQIPDRNGEFPAAGVAGEEVTVFLISAKSNHALAMFAPGFKQLGNYFRRMSIALGEGAADNGFLGQTSWMNTDPRGIPEYLGVQYWRSVDDLHAFAHSPLHRDGWEWWTRTAKQHPHLALYHEVYAVSSKNWQNIYINSEPTGLGATSYIKKGGKAVNGVVAEEWISPVVDARRGTMRTMMGRMGRGTGAENEKYEPDPYEE